MFRIIQVEFQEDVKRATELFREYAASLDFELSFQHFERELATLPGDYAPPRGRLLLAEVSGRLAGCGALRPFDAASAEVKRLYVRPEFRREGVGRLLMRALIAEARAIGYARIILDTVASMVEAVTLYKSLGFVEIEPYRINSLPGATFLALELGAP